MTCNILRSVNPVLHYGCTHTKPIRCFRLKIPLFRCLYMLSTRIADIDIANQPIKNTKTSSETIKREHLIQCCSEVQISQLTYGIWSKDRNISLQSTLSSDLLILQDWLQFLLAQMVMPKTTYSLLTVSLHFIIKTIFILIHSPFILRDEKIFLVSAKIIFASNTDLFNCLIK